MISLHLLIHFFSKLRNKNKKRANQQYPNKIMTAHSYFCWTFFDKKTKISFENLSLWRIVGW